MIQDGMLKMLRSGTISFASATAFSLSEGGMQEMVSDIADYRSGIVRRPQEISNIPS